MTKQQLESIIEKVRNGFQVERSTLDLKRHWWNFKKKSDLDEFLKDICSMANAQSGDANIILGVDEAGKVYDAPIPDDEANIQSRHKDQIEPRVRLMVNEFEVENKTVSVITIPHSTNRPHIIKRHLDIYNWIPVRFGSSTLTASRSDLDEMYDERDKTNESDLHIRLYEEKIRWGNYSAYGGCCFLVRLSIDNYAGGAPDFIVKAVIRQSRDTLWRSKHFMFEGQNLDQELRIGPHERKQAVQLYLSNINPAKAKKKCALPVINDKELRLTLYARSGTQSVVTLKKEWLVKK